MSDVGRRRFGVTRLPRDTNRLIEHVVEEAAKWATLEPETEAEREQYTVLSFARKFLSEHLELLCEEAGVEPQDTDVFVRF